MQVEEVLCLVCGQRRGSCQWLPSWSSSTPLLENGQTPSTLRAYMAAISSRHTPIGNANVGSQWLISSFLRGANRLRPPVTPRIPAWDLSLVRDALSSPPFEPLAQAELRWLSMKTAFHMATSAKRLGELHALSPALPAMGSGWVRSDSLAKSCIPAKGAATWTPLPADLSGSV